MARIETLREKTAQSKKIRRRGLLAAAVAGVLTGSAWISSAQAANFTWDTNLSGQWTTGSNWIGGIAPSGTNTTDNLIFGGTEGVQYQAQADTIDPFIINGLTFNSSALTTINTIGFINSQGISLAGTNPFITQNGTGAFQIDAPLILTSNATFGGTGAGLVTTTGVISGAGSLTITGGNWKTTNAANTFTGGLAVNGGLFEWAPVAGSTVNLAAAAASGAGTGTIRISNGAEFRITTADVNSGQNDPILVAGQNARSIAFGAGGGTLNLNGRIANGPTWTIDLTTATGSTSVIKFNGGLNGVSTNDPNNGDLQVGSNALRIATWTGQTANTPVRLELTNGALLAMQGGYNTLNMPITIRGVLGGDVHAQGKEKTTGRGQLDSGTAINGFPTYTWNGGLFIEDTFQLSLAGDDRTIDANITLRGTASGHPAQFGVMGRGTGTALIANQEFQTYLGRNDQINQKTITIEPGALLNLDARFRTDQANTNGVVVNAKTTIAAGGNVRLSQSWDRNNDAANRTGFMDWRGDITANGDENNESVIEVQLPFVDGTRAAVDHIGGATFGVPGVGGAQAANAADLIVNGSNAGTGGGLKITAIARQTKLYTANNGDSQGLAFPTDPVDNNTKLVGNAKSIASAGRLAALTGSGGFITFAPQDIAFQFPNGGDWAASVPVGLKVIDSNSTGDDVMMNGPFTHNVNIVSGATLNGNGNTLGPAAVTAGLGLVKGTGTISNAILNTGARLAPGFNSIATINGSGTLTINGTLEADVTTSAQDLLAMSGDLSLGSNSILDLPVTNSYDGTSAYTIATYSGLLNGAFAIVNNLPSGYIVDYGGGNNGSIRLTIPPPGSKIWTGAVNGNWDTTTGNWLPSNFANGNDVTFDDSATGTTSVTIVSPVTPASVTVNNTSKNYTIGGAAITGTTGLTKAFAGTLTLTGTNSFTGPVTIKNGVVSVAAVANSGAGSPLGAGSAINMGDVGSAGTLRFTGASGTTNRAISLTGLGGIIDTPAGSSLQLSGIVSGTGGLKKINGGNLTLSGNNAGWSGPIILLGTGTTTAATANSLGTGGVTVGDGTAANSNVLNYNAAGASSASPGVTVTPLNTVVVGANLGAGDGITVQPDAVLTIGTSTTASSLNRATNVNAQDGAIIAESQAGKNNAVSNLGSAGDLYFGLAGNVADTVTVGSGTPWKGISTDVLADRTLNNGSVINANSDFNLHSINGRKLILGSSGGGVTINNSPNANIASYVVLAGTASSYNNVNFDIHTGSTLELLNSTVLGSGANIGHVTVENGGLLNVSNSTAANGAVTVLDGGVLDVSIPGLSGSGTITEQPGGIVQINNAAALTGTQLTGPGIASGAIVRMAVDNITNISNTNGAAVFEIYGASTGTQNAGVNLNNGGILTNDGSDRTFASSTGLNIGTGGGTLAGTTGKTLSYAGSITTTNPLTIGTNATIDGNAKLGVVALGGTISAPITMGAGTLRVAGTIAAPSTIDMVNGTASFVDGAVLNGTINTNNTGGTTRVEIHAGHNGSTGNISGTGVINLSNGEDVVGFVDEVAAATPATVNVVPTTINILNTGTLASDREGPALGNTGAVRFTDVRLQPGSDLTFSPGAENVGAELTLLGNATIRGATTNNRVRVGNINDNGNHYTLTTAGDQNFRIVGTVQGTTTLDMKHSGTVQLNTTNFNPAVYTSAFNLNGNTINLIGAYGANVSGGPIPGLSGAGITELGNDPGAGTINATGGTLNVFASTPSAVINLNGSRVITQSTITMGTVNLNTTAEFLINNANSVVTINSFNQAPHAALVIAPNANDSNPVGTAGLGITSKLLLPNNAPTVTNGMVSPSIVRRNNGDNEGFFLTYDTTNGFRSATVTSTNIDTAISTDIVQLTGTEYTVDQTLTADRTIWALKSNQNIRGFGLKLTVGSGGIIFYNGANGNTTIEPNVAFGNTEAFIYAREGGGDFSTNPGNKNRDTFAGEVSGTAGLTKFGGGDIHLAGINTFTGPITIQRGRIVIDSGTGIGTGGVNIVQPGGGDGRNLPLTVNANSSTYNGNSNHHPSTFDLNGILQSVDGINGNGAVTSSNSSAPLLIDKTPGTATFTGAIFGGIQLYKLGSGTQILAPGVYGDNTYDSGTRVVAGTLLVNNTSGSGTGSGAVGVDSGATLGGSGSIAAFADMSGGSHLAPGAGPGTVGTFTLQGLGLNGTILDYDGDGSGVDRLNVGSDGLSVSGTNTINVAANGLASGDYVIIDYTSGNPDLSQFQLGPAPSGYALSLLHDIDNSNILLHVVSSGPPQWNVDASGSWGIAGNWQGGIPAAGGTANLLGKITAPRTITLDGNRSVANLNFDNANKYTIAQGSTPPGGTLTVTNAITVTSGTHEISAPLSLSGAVSKSGPGTLIISGAQSNAAGSSLTVTGGQVNLNSNAGASATAGSAASANLALTVAGSSVVLGANQDLGGLSIPTANPGAQSFDLASPAGAGQFRAVHIYAADLAGAKTSLYNAIKNAITNANDGIFDSGLAAHPGAKIGIAQVADAHGDQSIFIRPTKVGDLNLDGVVSISDFIDLASHFNGVGTWQEGDLNYDGSVTISDFIDLASNFNTGYAGGVTPISADDQQLLSSFASSIGVDPSVIGSAVPEPSTLGIAAVGVLGLLRRRTTRSAEGRSGGQIRPKGRKARTKGAE